MFDPNFNQHLQDFGGLIQFLKSWSYAGIFLLSIIASYVLPIPEAIFLLLVGFVARKSGLNIVAVVALSTAGIMLGDNLLYRLSFFGNKFVEKFNRKMRQHKLIVYEHLVVDNVAFSVYFLKFIAGVRFFGPVILGSLRAPWKKFFVHNAIASILHTGLLILLGYYFHRKIMPLAAGVEIFKNGMLFCSVVMVGFVIKLVGKKAEKQSGII
ncbi:MAG: DedA family protein [Candidatus Moraniibacteriota bacterium]